MNILRKKSRVKVITILLLALFVNYLVSPMAVFAGTYLTEIETKIVTIEESLASAKLLNDAKKIACLDEKYCIAATDEITTSITTLETRFNEIKDGLTLSRLVSLTAEPVGYEYLSAEDKATTINYLTVTEITENRLVTPSQCMVENVIVDTITTEEECTLASGDWTEEVNETITLSVDQIESMILTAFTDISTDLNTIDNETAYVTDYDNKVAALRLTDQNNATEAINDLLDRLADLTAIKNNRLSTLNTFKETNPSMTEANVGSILLGEYLEILNNLYKYLLLEEAFIEDYENVINNEIYSYAYGDEWTNQTATLTANYNALIAIDLTETKTTLTTKINSYTDIDNLTGITMEEDFLKTLLNHIKLELPMVTNTNIKKIETALLSYYVLTSSDPEIVINHTNRTIVTSYVGLEQSIFESKVTMNKGSYALGELVTGTDLEQNTIYTIKSGTTITLKTEDDVTITTYTVSVIGDANSDGNVDLNDLDMLESLVLGDTTTSDYTQTQLKALDYNGDGLYNVTDVAMLYSTLTVVAQ